MAKKQPRKNTSNAIGKQQTALRKYYERFIKIRGNPREIALGFALGLFIGMTPTLGFQMPIAIFFAALFKWNKISSVLGVWITNPVTAPFIYTINYWLGAKFLGIKKAFNLPAELNLDLLFRLLLKTPEILVAMTIGGVIVGLPLALFGYFFSYSTIQKYREDIKPKLAKQKEKLQLYRKKRKNRRGT